MGEIVAQTPLPVPANKPPSGDTQLPTTPLSSEEDEPPSQEEIAPEDIQQAEQEADSQLPKIETNPFNRPNIDQIIQQQFSEDMWRIMRGALPCIETSANCLQQLQDRAVLQSPLLREIDTRIQEANDRINEAKARNKRSIQLAVLTPGLQYLLGPAPANPQQRTPGILDNIAAIIRGDINVINGLLRVVGVPFFQGTQGGNAEAQARAIQISDLQIKVAELQRGRAQLAENVREKVAIALLKFDEARTQYQTAQIVAARAAQQFQVFEIRYVRGNSDTETYLSRQNQLDNIKARTYESWGQMRRSLFELKLLVLNVKEAEI